ncbi:MAG: hypothetical protein JWR38_1540 [Mucilaginibacter sp.]|nr:hypothetical protein [Mucilaginibacter sp.]
MKPFFEERDTYAQTLDQAIAETEQFIKQFPHLTIYRPILQQLLYIQNIVVTEKRRPNPKDVDQLTAAQISLKNFDDYSDGKDPYARLLFYIYHGFKRYSEEADTREKIVKEIALSYLQKLKIKYDAIEDPEYKTDYDIQTKGGGSQKTNVWIIPYTYTVFEEEMAFIYLDDHCFELIYIMTKHGYITA